MRKSKNVHKGDYELFYQNILLEDKIFTLALVISLLVHAACLIRLSHSGSHYLKKPLKPLEVTYYDLKPEKTKKESPSAEPETIKEEKLGKNSKVLIKNDPDISPLIKDLAKLPLKGKLQDKQPLGLGKMRVERKITVPPLKSEKINNPVYLNYYDLVREKIKERAYMNYSKLDAGDVYLTFVLLSDGTLKQIRLIEEKSSTNDYLKNIGLRSIKEASPFPAFPKDLNYPELSFNVVISFEIKETTQ